MIRDNNYYVELIIKIDMNAMIEDKTKLVGMVYIDHIIQEKIF